MADLKPYWPEPPLSTHELSGDAIVSSGSDPNADGGKDGGQGLQEFWPDEKRILSAPGGEETGNSSGLPPLPNRFEPSADSVEIPDLTDRNPGTIDKR